MKKRKTMIIIFFLVQAILISSSVYAIQSEYELDKKNTTNIISLDLIQQFSTPEIREFNDYFTIHLDETTNFISIPGKPVLPIYIKTIELPFGSKLKDIRCDLSDIFHISISKQIIPALKPSPFYNERTDVQLTKEKAIYSEDQYYPENWFSYKLTGGLNKDNIETTFLTIQLNPVKYNPIQNNIQYVKSIVINLKYEKPITEIVFPDEFDLLIISHNGYAPLLKSLVTHKNDHGISTKLVRLREIYRGKYFDLQGEDKPEQIKYFIKDAKENWGINYVMLVGNFRKIPTRYSHLQTDAGGIYEELEFACDLYYADIYDSTGNFSSWDTNDNGIYGEWNNSMEDELDLSPDLYVGRLACMYNYEVRTMVDKIIDYEDNAYGSEWSNNMILCGGDTFDKSIEGGTDYDEGEIACEKAIEYMTGYNHTRIYASLDNLYISTIHNTITQGAGFLYFVGHGNPRKWGTHYNGDYINWTESYNNKEMLKLSHKGMYPILMVGGCHNSQFDVTPMNIIKGLLTEKLNYFSSDPQDLGSFWTSNWVPECWSWVFVKRHNGGAIASMGSTGYGGVEVGDFNNNDIPDCIEFLDGWFETQFFRLYNDENIDILGETYGQTITDYVNTFPVYTDRYDCKIVETHVLLGDPSLKIGGYQ